MMTDAERWARAKKSGLLLPLADRARFSLTGADRVRFLNGQCSADIRKLSPGGPAVAACVLTVKGKLDAVIHVWAEADRLIIDCDASVAEALAPRLEKYIIADDVTVEPVETQTAEWHFLPGEDGMPAALENHRVRAISRLRRPGYDLSGADVPALVDAAGAISDDAALWDLMRVVTRTPAWGHELTADTLPAEAGLDTWAVDFHKGCYIGQEVVSRIESVGHANRVLRQFTVTDGPPPLPGEDFPSADTSTRPAATITTVAMHFGLSKAVGLCYTRRGIELGAELTSADSATRITITELSE